MDKSKRWEPVRVGSVYCSPACGADCSFEDFEKAKTGAKLLADGLGEGWAPSVWENMGWHWQAVSKKGRASVRLHGFTYHADIHLGERQFLAQATTPRAAFRKALQKADEIFAKATEDRAAFEKLR